MHSWLSTLFLCGAAVTATANDPVDVTVKIDGSVYECREASGGHGRTGRHRGSDSFGKYRNYCDCYQTGNLQYQVVQYQQDRETNQHTKIGTPAGNEYFSTFELCTKRIDSLAACD